MKHSDRSPILANLRSMNVCHQAAIDYLETFHKYIRPSENKYDHQTKMYKLV